jgi:hypothetical protein
MLFLQIGGLIVVAALIAFLVVNRKKEKARSVR